MEENNDIKWMRIKDVIISYGIKKTKLYELLKAQEIENKLISPKVRIVSVKSIEKFIDSK